MNDNVGVRSEIVADTSKEEDFATQIFNRPLLQTFSAGEILDLLKAARTWLSDCDLPSHLTRALTSRLEARSALLKLFRTCSRGDRPSISALEQQIALVKKIEDSAFLGRPTSAAAFTLKIQRRLASSVPPRPMITIQKEQCYPFLRQLLTGTATAFQILDTSSSVDLFTAYQGFSTQEPQPAVYVRALLQSFLNIDGAILGRFAVKDFIVADIRCLVLPFGPLSEEDHRSDITEDEQAELGSRVEIFVDRCGNSSISLFRTLCLNRCRIRRTMCHATLEWDQIQAEAEDLDSLAQSILKEPAIPYLDGEEPTFSYSFSSWVYHYKLVQLRTVLQMGFELSIYASYEHSGLYWYLSFLTGTHLSHLERISFFVASGPRTGISRQADVQKTLKHLYRLFTWLKATEAMAKALHRVFTVLQRHGHFPKPAAAYASEVLRYELRMRPFLHLTIPEPINLDVARRSSSLQALSDEEVVDQASKFIQTARKAWEEVLKAGWNFDPLLHVDSASDETQVRNNTTADTVVEREWTRDVRNSIRACIGTGIAITTLSRLVRNSTNMAGVQVDLPGSRDRDRWHMNWPVPKIQS